ncbi:DBR1-domain-containing protein [Cristinia sonorae]|uniref:DBR1-domain-containing protein n=1 Tax=Cristinia sonorae TaxID=1940300 RepID=A0A8K0UN11_9AGAR|nr:DBR1-domain-containing protein [Cristinia sonorae]
MKIAIEGCCHGELEAIYSHIASLEASNGYKVDLLLICGDFQAIRNERDLQCMAVPDKYRKLGEFHKYYTGEKKAPILTIVIGGNHEASNYFWELYHGGWIAPNMYFLGHAGCVQVNGVRIAGASGIFKGQDFRNGHWERLPYNAGAMRSIYHIREFNILRLSLLSRPTIFLSHDWPQSIEHYGNLRGLIKRKPYFQRDIETGNLGSPPMMGLLTTLKPEWWFSAHLHCRFEASVVHPGTVATEGHGGDAGSSVVLEKNPDEIVIEDDEFGDVDPAPATEVAPVSEVAPPAAVNPDEIVLDDEEEEVAKPPAPPPPPLETKFLALDKCLPKRQFLEVIDVPTSIAFQNSPPTVSFDPEWLAITRAFNPFMSMNRNPLDYPDEPTAREAVQRELDWVKKNIFANDDGGGDGVELKLKLVEDVQSFVKTAPAPGEDGSSGKAQPPHYPNPQTAAFCSMLEIENKVDYAR